jgi:ribosomal protein S18 acetylase RimI-like enzyme
MVLADAAKLDDVDTAGVRQLGAQDLPDLQVLYAASYPGNWFDPRMLETGQYVGIRSSDQSLLSVAGVHVYSEEYRVAALGNITTHPDHRGRGLGTAVTAALCKHLLDSTETIGLNVKTDNAPAIHTYRKLGFEVVASYHEWMIELN